VSGTEVCGVVCDLHIRENDLGDENVELFGPIL
jgi:hypothetical protein